MIPADVGGKKMKTFRVGETPTSCRGTGDSRVSDDLLKVWTSFSGHVAPVDSSGRGRIGRTGDRDGVREVNAQRKGAYEAIQEGEMAFRGGDPIGTVVRDIHFCGNESIQVGGHPFLFNDRVAWGLVRGDLGLVTPGEEQGKGE